MPACYRSNVYAPWPLAPPSCTLSLKLPARGHSSAPLASWDLALAIYLQPGPHRTQSHAHAWPPPNASACRERPATPEHLLMARLTCTHPSLRPPPCRPLAAPTPTLCSHTPHVRANRTPLVSLLGRLEHRRHFREELVVCRRGRTPQPHGRSTAREQREARVKRGRA
eukprot:1147688-Prymnesium_polylepis.1